MSLIDFESGTKIEKNREWERKVRQNILERAKEKYEQQQKREEQAKERGETSWMLPSVEAKIDSKKKKKCKKEKKSKHKKSKKRKSSSSSYGQSEGDDEEVWVERTGDISKRGENEVEPSELPVKRDEWMEMTSLFRTHTRDEIKIKDGSSRTLKRLEERIKKEEANKPGSHSRELNPYYKEGGEGLPLEEATPTTISKCVTTYDAVWLRKALKRAEDQAKEEGRTLEEIAKDRWGSLDNFKKLLNEAERTTPVLNDTKPPDRRKYQTMRDSRNESNSWSSDRADRNISDGQRKESRSRNRQSFSRNDWESSRSSDKQESRNKDRQKNRNRSRDRQRSRSRSRNRQRSSSQSKESQKSSSTSRDRERRTSRSNERQRSNSSTPTGSRTAKEGDQVKHSPALNKNIKRSREEDNYQNNGSSGDDKKLKNRSKRSSSTSSSDSSLSSSSNSSGSNNRRNTSGSKMDTKGRSSTQSRSSASRDDRSSQGLKGQGMLRPHSDEESPIDAACISSSFKKPNESEKSSNSKQNYARESSLSASSKKCNWRKKTDVYLDDKKNVNKLSAPASVSSSSSSSSSDSEEEMGVEAQQSEEQPPQTTKAPILTDKEMNQLGAKLTKAELLGNEELVTKLKGKLETARLARAEQGKTELNVKESKVTEEVVLLTKTDASGFTRPVSHREREGKPKKKRKENMYNKVGERTRYFPDDDDYDLKTMFEKEKNTTAKEQLAMFERIGSEKLSEDFDVDDMFMANVAPKEDSAKQEERERNSAIIEHQRTQKTMESCHFCVGNKVMKKHLIVALGSKCYISVPHHHSLTEGHCFIVPIHHVMCGTMADEDLWEEVMNYRKALVKMFESRGEDCVFFETVMNIRNLPHMVIQCIPLEKDVGDLAPIYFKKAIQECDDEWSQNKKLIDLKGRNVRKAVPKGLPYFSVDFGLTPGFAHVIENELIFPKNFAQEIIGGMIDADISLFRKPKAENFDTQRKKVLQFADMFKPFDPYPQ